RLPSELAGGLHARRDVGGHRDASCGSIAARRLLRGEIDEDRVGRRIDETEAEERRRTAAGDGVRLRRHLLRAERMRGPVARTDRLILNQRTAELRQRIEDAVHRRAETGDEPIAAAAHTSGVVALTAGASVEDGTEAVGDGFDFDELGAAVVERGELRR